jgi:hypothetical protein
MPTRWPLCLLLLAAASACSYPRFAAKKTVEYEVPADTVQRLRCESHNGSITVVGDAAAQPIRLRAEITARAGSQIEADALLHELVVRRDVADGCLAVAGQGPSGWSIRSEFAFTITVPPSVAVDLQSHNGGVHVTGLTGAVHAETHNGEIVAEVATDDVSAISHNGDVRLQLRGSLREASVETHNGEVVVELGAGTGAQITAATHNGRIDCQLPLQDRRQDRDSLSGRLGDGQGHLRVTTHNGDVVLR